MERDEKKQNNLYDMLGEDERNKKTLELWKESDVRDTFYLNQKHLSTLYMRV